MNSNISVMEKSGECVHLPPNQSYQEYFDLLTRASETLANWYKRVVDGGGDEEKIVASYLAKLIFTVKLLALKHSNSDAPKLRLDLNKSGYPHLLGIVALETDLRQKDEVLRTMTKPDRIKRSMLDVMLGKGEEPKDLLETMALRRYFELLNEHQALLAFMPGELILQSQDEKMRHYMFSWCSYDVDSNVPHVYIMLFEQDIDEDPLEEKGTNYTRFMDVVRGEGGRVPALSIVAVGIDTALDSIHPKIIKRIKLGPLYNTRYSVGESPLLEYLRKYGKPEDFILHVRDEMVFSSKEEVTKKSWLSPSKVRQIFWVPADDIDCAHAGASCIRRMLVMPHHIAQQLNRAEPALAPYQALVAYTTEGEVHAI